MIAEEAPRSPDAGPNPFSDDGETMRDIRTPEALREASASFQDALVEESAIQDCHIAAQLRQEPVYQMAEFFFLHRAFRLDGEDKVRRYAELHNRHLEELQADYTRMRRLGLSPTRVQKGKFSPDSIPKLVENYHSGDGAIDQSDLSRLLIEAMSPEPSSSRSLVQDQPKPATHAEATVLAENPDLSQYYRESPETDLDLLRLIRDAAKKQ